MNMFLCKACNKLEDANQMIALLQGEEGAPRGEAKGVTALVTEV